MLEQEPQTESLNYEWPARHYLRWVNLVILAPLATVRRAENGSARYTRKMKRGIAALSSPVMKAVKGSNRLT